MNPGRGSQSGGKQPYFLIGPGHPSEGTSGWGWAPLVPGQKLQGGPCADGSSGPGGGSQQPGAPAEYFPWGVGGSWRTNTHGPSPALPCPEASFHLLRPAMGSPGVSEMLRQGPCPGRGVEVQPRVRPPLQPSPSPKPPVPGGHRSEPANSSPGKEESGPFPGSGHGNRAGDTKDVDTPAAMPAPSAVAAPCPQGTMPCLCCWPGAGAGSARGMS